MKATLELLPELARDSSCVLVRPNTAVGVVSVLRTLLSRAKRVVTIGMG